MPGCAEVMAWVGFVPTKVGTYPRLRLSPVRAQADVAFDDAALLVAVTAQLARVVGHRVRADGAVEAPYHADTGFERA